MRASSRVSRRGTGWRAFIVTAASALVSAFLHVGAQGQGAKPAAGDGIFQTTALHKIHVTVSAAEWAVLQTAPRVAVLAPDPERTIAVPTDA